MTNMAPTGEPHFEEIVQSPARFHVHFRLPDHLLRRHWVGSEVLLPAGVVLFVVAFRMAGRDAGWAVATVTSAACLTWAGLAALGKALHDLTLRTTVAVSEGRLIIDERFLLWQCRLMDCRRIVSIEPRLALGTRQTGRRTVGLTFVCDAPFPEYPKRHRHLRWWMWPHFPYAREPERVDACHRHHLDFELSKDEIEWLRLKILEAAEWQGMLVAAEGSMSPPSDEYWLSR